MNRLNGQVTNAFGNAVPDDLMEDGQFGIHGRQFRLLVKHQTHRLHAAHHHPAI